eukprot:g63340.t1
MGLDLFSFSGVIDAIPALHMAGAVGGVAGNLGLGGALVMTPNKLAKTAGVMILIPGTHYVAAAAVGSTLQGLILDVIKSS